MNCKEIQKILATKHWHYLRHTIVPNCHFLGWEADLLVLSASGYLEEVEIKISFSDFCQEFKSDTKIKKHGSIQRGTRKNAMRKRFWFAVPASLVDKVEDRIPDYAGLMSVTESGVRIVRRAPLLLNSRKLSDLEQKKLMRLLGIRYWSK